MRPGTKTRKVGLQIPTVNPCNDFIIDYLIRNKIKSDKQIMCKSYLYNLAIEAVRKYPLPLLSQQQLAALQGFGDFFINQVGRLIKNHYMRKRMPTQEQMDQDDQAHFAALRVKAKENQEKSKSYRMRIDHNRDLSSPVRVKFQDDDEPKIKNYKPKKNTQPYNILDAMYQAKAYQNSISKWHINQSFYNNKQEKLRLWYVLKNKLQNNDFIQQDQLAEDFYFLTEKGKKYIEEYDENQKNKKRKTKKEQSNESNQQGSHDDLGNQSSRFQSKTSKTKLSTQASISQSSAKNTYLSKVQIQIDCKRQTFPKSTNFGSVFLLINNSNQKICHSCKSIIQNDDEINYEICDMLSFTFMWSINDKLLDYFVIVINVENFDCQQLKTACFLIRALNCQNYLIILEGNFVKEQSDLANLQQQQTQTKNQYEMNMQDFLCEARAKNYKIAKTKNQKQTLQIVMQMHKEIVKKVSIYVSIRNKKQKSNESETQNNQNFFTLKHLGTQQKLMQKMESTFKASTIFFQILRCIPDMNKNTAKTLADHFKTIINFKNKLEEYQSSKLRRQFLKSILVNQIQKQNQEALKTLVQLFFYEEY